MGLFNFFRQNQLPTTASTNYDPSQPPRELSAENKESQEQTTAHSFNGQANGIEVVYTFLQADYETRGYSDALINADNSNKSDGIKLIKLDLQLLLRRVINYYEKKIKDYEVQISSRSRAGLMDLVEELRSEKDKAEKDIEEVKTIYSEMESGTGLVERIILSYQKGFMRGLSAITQSRMIK